MISPISSASAPVPIICELATFVVREVPFKSTAPNVMMLPPRFVVPVPRKVSEARDVASIPSPETPIPFKFIVPLPLDSVRP